MPRSLVARVNGWGERPLAPDTVVPAIVNTMEADSGCKLYAVIDTCAPHAFAVGVDVATEEDPAAVSYCFDTAEVPRL